MLLWHIHSCLWWRGSGKKYSEVTISWDGLFKCVGRIVHDQVCVCRNFIPSVRTVKEHNVLFNPIAYTCQMFVLLYCWCFVNLLYLIYCIYYYMIANENAPLYVYQFSISCNAMNCAMVFMNRARRWCEFKTVLRVQYVTGYSIPVQCAVDWSRS